MPELPEVEVTRRGVEPLLIGQRILAAHLGKPLRWPLGTEPKTLEQSRVLSVQRRGKYLVVGLDVGVLLIHLGMSGSLLAHTGPGGELRAHEHFGLDLTNGHLRLHDPRRFGAVVWAPSAVEGMAAKLLGGVGPEPFSPDLTPQTLHAGFKRSAVAIKPLLLAGKLVCGVGNIYASEALFLAGIRPQRRAARVSLAQATALLAAVRLVLSQAIEAGGSSLKDFRHSDGSSGHFQTQTRVYGREHEACGVCAAPIRMIRQGQRSTYFCARCQK